MFHEVVDPIPLQVTTTITEPWWNISLARKILVCDVDHAMTQEGTN